MVGFKPKLFDGLKEFLARWFLVFFFFMAIPRAVNKLEFRLCQSPGVRATQRGPYCINTDLFAIDRTAGAFALSKFQFSNGSGYKSVHNFRHYLHSRRLH